MKNTRTDMLAMVGGVLTAIEIKSAKDSTKRLARQIEEARWRFRQVIVVTEPKHADVVRQVVDPACGIWVCEERENGFFLRRRSADFGTRAPRLRKRLHPHRLMTLLRKDELVQALGIAEASRRRKSDLIDQLVDQCSAEEIEAVVLTALRERKRAALKPHLASA